MDTPERIALGRAIKAARIMKGLSQHELAELVGVSVHVVRSWEQGRSEISALRLGIVAVELGVSADSLLIGACA